jgi:Mrp family chromosome partitioning ATPase/capsular polysaccharide biosynthesis protein
LNKPSPEPGWDGGPGLLEAVWRYRWLVVAATLVAMMAGFGASFLQTTMYEGEARLLLRDPRDAGVFRESGQRTIDPARYVRNQAEFAESSAVAARTAELIDNRLGIQEIQERVTAQPSADLDLIVIRPLDPSAAGAAQLANAVAEAYQQRIAEEVRANADAAIAEFDRQKAQLQERIATAESRLRADPDDSAARAERDGAVSQLITLESRADQIAVEAALYGAGVELFEPAEVPESPAQPRPLRNAAVAGVLSLLAASAFAWWRAEQTQSADLGQDAAPVLRAPLLGEVPEFADVGVEGALPTQSAPHTPAAEAYQFIIASLEYALRDLDRAAVLVTSPGPGDGKTVTSANLAVAATQDGRRVLLVDADERARGLTQLAEVAPEPGLTDAADPEIPLEGCIAEWRLSQRLRLPFMPAGSKVGDPAGYFRTTACRAALRRIREQADLVLLDSPPLLAVSDASSIASQVDGIVLVVTRGTPLRMLEDVRHRLDFLGTPLLGYVFNRGITRSGRYAYGYAYGYGGEGSGAANGQTQPARRSRVGRLIGRD